MCVPNIMTVDWSSKNLRKTPSSKLQYYPDKFVAGSKCACANLHVRMRMTLLCDILAIDVTQRKVSSFSCVCPFTKTYTHQFTGDRQYGHRIKRTKLRHHIEHCFLCLFFQFAARVHALGAETANRTALNRTYSYLLE